MCAVDHLKKKPQTAGGEVDTYCSRCALELAHVIVAMNGPRIVRVQCKTCKTVHGFHAPAAPGGERAKRAPREGGHRGGAIGDNAYDQVMRGRDISRARPYRPVLQYETNDVLSHPTFGIGAVTKVLADNKIEAAFRSGLKVLVHGRG